MKILIVVPFRTSLELPIAYSAQRPTELIDALKCASKQLQESLGSNCVINPLAVADDSPIELYKQLNEDAIPITLLPLLNIEFLNVIASIDVSVPGCSKTRLDYAAINIYDHTLGIMELVFDFERMMSASEFEKGMDCWAEMYVGLILKKLHGLSIATFNSLTSAQLGHGNGIMSPVGRRSSFFDMQMPAIRSLNPKPLWVSRVIFTDTNEIDKKVWDAWTQGQTSERPEVNLGKQSAVLCVGNSVVFGKVDETIVDIFQRSLRLSNLIYAAVHVINRNLRAVHGDFIGGRINPAFAADITSLIRNKLDFVERDYEDGLQGLQGSRSSVVNGYLKAWSFGALIETSHKRMASISVMIQESIVRRSIRYSRIVESTLSVIGGITLLDFSLNLMTFSRSDSSVDDGVYGLVDFVKDAAEDKLLFALLLIVGFVGISKFIKK